jgi:hypothetical protein
MVVQDVKLALIALWLMADSTDIDRMLIHFLKTVDVRLAEIKVSSANIKLVCEAGKAQKHQWESGGGVCSVPEYNAL